MLENGDLRIYLYGGEYVGYNPEWGLYFLKEYKYQGTAVINEDTVSLKLVKELYSKVTRPKKVVIENADLNLGKVKSNTKAGEELIQKYRNALNQSAK